MKNKELYDKIFEGLEDHEIITICLTHVAVVCHATDPKDDLPFDMTIPVNLYLTYRFNWKKDDPDLLEPPTLSLERTRDLYIEGYKGK